MLENYDKHDVAIYGGYIDDNSLLLQSTSGGIATAMAQHMIDKKGYVVGVTYSEDFHSAEYVIIDSKLDIDKLKGSKYIECEKAHLFSKVKEILDAGENLLFFGLPCIVAALYKFLGYRPDKLLTCELICYGPTSAEIHSQYIDYLENKFKGKIIDFSVRRKRESWTPTYLYAKFDNGEIFEKLFSETEYGYAFSVFGREACYQCRFKGNNRKGDIMIGDFWGADENDPYWNKYGVSVIFAETDKGNNFLCSVPNIKLFSTTFEKAVKGNQMVIKSKVKMKNREKFSRLFKKRGLFYAAKHSRSFRTRIKRILMKLIFKV